MICKVYETIQLSKYCIKYINISVQVLHRQKIKIKGNQNISVYKGFIFQIYYLKASCQGQKRIFSSIVREGNN